MRKILFKGFHECENGTHKAFYGGAWHKGEWVYGYYGRKGVDEKTYKHYICKPVFNSNGTTYNGEFYFEDIEVVPETVCQYAGLTDKNGKKIFEGDILKGKFYGFMAPVDDFVFCVSWNEDVKGFQANNFEVGECEIIGNKFENPELVEVEE